MAATSFIRLLASYLDWYLNADKFLVGMNTIKLGGQWSATFFFTDHSGQYPGTATVTEEYLQEWEIHQADAYEASANYDLQF